jgi:hypothetical protein
MLRILVELGWVAAPIAALIMLGVVVEGWRNR